MTGLGSNFTAREHLRTRHVSRGVYGFRKAPRASQIVRTSQIVSPANPAPVPRERFFCQRAGVAVSNSPNSQSPEPDPVTRTRCQFRVGGGCQPPLKPAAVRARLSRVPGVQAPLELRGALP